MLLNYFLLSNLADVEATSRSNVPKVSYQLYSNTYDTFFQQWVRHDSCSPVNKQGHKLRSYKIMKLLQHDAQSTRWKATSAEEQQLHKSSVYNRRISLQRNVLLNFLMFFWGGGGILTHWGSKSHFDFFNIFDYCCVWNSRPTTLLFLSRHNLDSKVLSSIKGLITSWWRGQLSFYSVTQQPGWRKIY